jgi:hypothetical protein
MEYDKDASKGQTRQDWKPPSRTAQQSFKRPVQD